jgi:hydrogenase maturation protease
MRVLCFGNPWHGDDGFGHRVFERLMAEERPPGVEVHDAGTMGLGAVHLLEGCDKAVLVDALAGDAVGRVRRLPVTMTSPPKTPLSLHALGVDGVLACVPILFEGRPPPELVVIGVEIGRSPRPFTEALSPPVAAAVPLAVSCVRREWEAI